MKIKKLATARHEATLSPFVRNFTAKAVMKPLSELFPFISTFPKQWPFPRGDLYHWIPLLNRFDTILEEMVNKYKLKDGPQTIEWHGEDKKLVIGILGFTRLLVENCGNRSLYASSGHIGELLNTTDIDVLLACLGLGWRLAQRYHTSRTRGNASTMQSTLLASHYNINLNKVVTLASPFVKSISVNAPRDKSLPPRTVLPVYASDLSQIARGGNPITASSQSKGKGKADEPKEGNWEEWGGAWISFYVNPKTQKPPAASRAGPKEPTTPTPARRSSLHHSQLLSGSSQNISSSSSRGRTTDEAPVESESTITGGLQTLEVPYSMLEGAPNLESIVEASISELPSDAHYEFLHRLRVASALTGDAETRRKILAVRILALTNLAYIFTEQQFSQKVLTVDQDEPRRLQIVYQLAELVQASDKTSQSGEVPLWLQTLALGALEAFARHKPRAADVCAALSVNVNHGVLLYILRKFVAGLSSEDGDEDSFDVEEWRDALFSLISFLPGTSHTGSLLVSAGLIPILVELINLRTQRALRQIPKALNLLDQLIYGVATAFQTFANAKGLDAVVDLAADQTQQGLVEVEQGQGVPYSHRAELTDYKISHRRQQTLKMVTKLMQNMMTQSGAGVDRLLRNLIDNPKLLEAIRLVIARGTIWGSSIWSTVVGMVSAFIHNEPTSYAVIHEAHITHTFLEAITGKTGLVEDEARRKKIEEARKRRQEEAERLGEAEEGGSGQHSTAVVSSSEPDANDRMDATPKPATDMASEIEEPSLTRSSTAGTCIMPSQDSIGSIPTAIGAICLNPLGLELIQASSALSSFFEIFESPAHVKLLIDGELDNLLGTQFDELVRHHPNLGQSVMDSTLRLLDRVAEIGKLHAVEHGIGAKIWLDDGHGGLFVSGGRAALSGRTVDPSVLTTAKGSGLSDGQAKGNDSEDVEMSDADAFTPTVAAAESQLEAGPVTPVITFNDLRYEEGDPTGKLLPITDFIDVAVRYLEGFINNTIQTKEFLRRGGLDKLLEFFWLPSLPYDFATSQANQNLCRAVFLCYDQNLVDTLNGVFSNAQKGVDRLQPLLEHSLKEPFFAPLINPSAKLVISLEQDISEGADDMEAEAKKQAMENVKENGTVLVKDLVTINSLTYLLRELYGRSIFNVRQSVHVFLQTAQEYDREGLIIKLGSLQRQCVWEEIQLQKGIPSDWDEVTKTKDPVAGVAIEAPIPQHISSSTANSGEASMSSEQKQEAQKAIVEKDGNTSWFRNVKTIRFLIGQIPTSINPFLQGIAKCVIGRRTNDHVHKYLAFKLVDSIADSMYTHLTWKRLDTSDSITDKYGYWIVMLSSVMSLILDGVVPDYFNTPKNTPPDRQPTLITTTLITFKQKGGMGVIKSILMTFWEELQSLPALDSIDGLSNDVQQRVAHAYGGIRIILSLFSYLVSNKAVLPSNQSEALHVRSISEFRRPDYFNTSQFLVELRVTILPVVQEMWESSAMEKTATSAIVKSVVEILGIILKADHEGSAFTRNDLVRRPGINNVISWKSMMPREEQIRQLTDLGVSIERAADALLRCNGAVNEAASFLASQGSSIASANLLPLPQSNPMDEGEGDDDDGDEDGSQDSYALASGHREQEVRVQPESSSAAGPLIASDLTQQPASESTATTVPSRLWQPVQPVNAHEDEATGESGSSGTANVDPTDAKPPSAIEKGKAKEGERQAATVVTVEDLEALRAQVRDSLIDRSLDVLQVQNEITFELADLIRSAFSKSLSETRKDVAETFVQSLLSLQMDDDFRVKSKTIASTAHLLGLILQDQAFYEPSVQHLNEQLGVLIGFIKIYRGARAPWVANILLVIEKLLSESAQPQKIKFTPGEIESETIVESASIKVSMKDKESLFDAIVNVLGDIDKDDGILSLAVARVLVLLTREKSLAVKMVQEGKLRKVFHMYRRQAGNSVDRLQPTILLLLRHIIEDDETLKAVMRSDIKAQFSTRPSRQIDTMAFAKNCAHLILRNPDIFVEVVNDLCKLARYDPHLRNQALVLKEISQPKPNPETSGDHETTGEGKDISLKKQDEKGEKNNDRNKETTDKIKTGPEIRPPGVEKPDGVIHFLLTELFAIKDVKDVMPQKEAAKPEHGAGGDTTMENSGITATGIDIEPAKPEKPEFKAEQYPFFFYRCFILMTLMELLCCYNRCKIEFINFNRKANPREPITPSKPRSAIFNYLLHDLISQQSLTAPPSDDIDQKTKDKLGQWAVHLFVSLCTQSGEVSSDEEEADLLFVRKFFFETALKSFRDACSSTEPFDTKYARMASLGDLFYKVLSVRPPCAPPATGSSEKAQRQLAKIMLEKNYISALTGALADVDLNYPNSRKVIKSMLKPLKLLSKTAVELGDTSELSSPGATDEDEISTASSISSIDDDEMREETPDLYRNSTLGLFEGGEMRDDEPSSYDEDEEDEEIYDEEMEFEEEIVDENESDTSDEEDEDGGENMDVEIVVQAENPDDSDEDEDMSEDTDEEAEEAEIIDELGDGHHHLHHHHEHYESGDEEGWQSDGSEDEPDEDEDDDDGIIAEHMNEMAENPLESIARVLGVGGDDGPDLDLDDENREDGFIDGEGDEDDDMDGDEEDDMDDAEAMLEDYDDDDEGGWFTLSGARDQPVFSMTRPGRARHYIGAAGERTQTSNREQNPLLVQPAEDEPTAPQHNPHHRHEYMGDFAQVFGGIHGGRADGGPVSMIGTLMNIMNRGGAVPNGAFQIQATIPHGPGHRFPHGAMQREFRSMFGNLRPSNEPHRQSRDDPSHVVRFEPSSTSGRWLEEARIMFGPRVEESAQRVINTILSRLVPIAIEEEKIRKEKEEEKRKEEARFEEERKKKEEEERIEKEKAEAEEKARKEAETKDAEERARVEAEARAAEDATSSDDVQKEEDKAIGDEMEGVETDQPEEAEPGPSEPPVERATVMIRGREMDITGMGIDPEFLEAIPEDMREEALTQHIRERRAAAASSDQPSEISREFLDALPDDIREELLQQEAADRRRREQETAQGRPGGPVDIDLASFLATLEPGLRQTVLMEQDEEALAQLPHAIVEEANALRGDRGFGGRFIDIPRTARRPGLVVHRDEPKALKKPVRRGAVQLLDKAGVATLLRLMFIPQVGSTRVTLQEILLNVCENRQNRAEVVNLLLSILQDGSADMISVERSFAQLSVRAKQPSSSHPLKPPSNPGLQRSNTGSSIFSQTSGEVSPLMVAQQCLNALLFLVNYNEHIPSYFLNEHDISTGLKRSLSRKGKGKATENKAGKYALNTLLSLLDRPLITESSTIMDQLSVLLSEITRPLIILLKKEKKKAEDEKTEGEIKPSLEKPVTDTLPTSAETSIVDTTIPSTDVGPATDSVAEASKSESKGVEPKRPRTLIPPVVPEYNLRLVVNILTARECTSKTFRETLATMQNLSGIPGSKDVFGAELIRQAQELGLIILGHLDELLQQVKNAENGTEVQGMALANFSPASSEQAKLLRVLTALDYLFDPKRTAKDTKTEDKQDSESNAGDAGQVLARLYESLTFTPLWSKLSDCLLAIHARSDMLHVATILLPLIEALMVVCKNSRLEETAAQKAQSKSEGSNSMRQLFFKFTEDHRKILNQMVRNNPKLMSGSFALLVKNPKVLDFDNKRNYFNRRLHARQGLRDPHPTLQLSVRRDQVFLDSYKSMYYKSGDEIKFAKLSIRFHGEEGVDAGGVTREWFQVMSRQMFNPDYALFIPVASDRTTFHPNSMSGVNPEHLSFFKFIGRIIGKALYEGRVLDCHFSRAVYKRILGKSVSLKDMETLDLEYYKSLVWMLENNIDDVITETFSVEVDEFGARRIIDLIPDGRNVPVTNENKQDYVRHMIEHRLLHSVDEQINHFLIGFHDIVSSDLISIFNEQELELLISGMPEIEIDDWKNNTEYHNYSASSSQIQWFWRAVRSFDKEERAKLLQFVTGTSKVPLNGFKELEGMNGFSKFNIHRDYGNKDRLPSSHTCFNQLDLPEYESYETLRQQLITAITQGAEYFGFA